MTKEWSEVDKRIQKGGFGDELEKILELAVKLFEDEELNPALLPKDPQEVLESLELSIPDEGRTPGELYSLVETAVMMTPRTCTRKFFNQLFGGRLFPAVAAEMIVSTLNNSMYTYKVAGVQILIEKEIIRTFCDYVGFENGDGIFSPGGSISNLVAMIVARNEADERIRDEGLDGRKYTLYTSDQGHYSILKNANFIGVGRKNVREIESDGLGRMRPECLRDAVKRDLADGAVPFFVNATSGTTVLGAFDPLDRIEEVAREFGLWFHVDAAFGGSLLLNPETRHKLQGCEKADSLIWNAHKMMGVPLSASVTLMSRPGLLHKHFNQQADYLFQSDADFINPGKKSIQCGRRNDAFKVWVAFQYFGRSGYSMRIQKVLDLARFAGEVIRQDPDLELFMEPESVNVCFRVKGKSSRQICELLDKKGLAKVGFGDFKGQSFIRLVCVDARMSENDIQAFFEDVKSVASEIECVQTSSG